MPLITGDGTYAANRPALSMPKPNWIAPDSSTASRNAEKLPSCAIPSMTITTRPAAGPLTLRREPLSTATTRPPTMPETSPANGSTPDAFAMPRQSGSATRKTTVPASRSR
ncbi:hypothetical protein GGD41_006295 [Paraburkholderia bryophila]|uniref:Uncharacterized protein n=1 Tax=Paraburkholderia bryophila TaxID=420952 RepID=A0A7Y9WE61_9BURK|nr:hypothetical protein [Paraburkholderia bryophila]